MFAYEGDIDARSVDQRFCKVQAIEVGFAGCSARRVQGIDDARSTGQLVDARSGNGAGNMNEETLDGWRRFEQGRLDLREEVLGRDGWWTSESHPRPEGDECERSGSDSCEQRDRNAEPRAPRDERLPVSGSYLAPVRLRLGSGQGWRRGGWAWISH